MTGGLAAEIQAVWPADWLPMAFIVDALLCHQDHRRYLRPPNLQDEAVKSVEAHLPRGLARGMRWAIV